MWEEWKGHTNVSHDNIDHTGKAQLLNAYYSPGSAMCSSHTPFHLRQGVDGVRPYAHFADEHIEVWRC